MGGGEKVWSRMAGGGGTRKEHHPHLPTYLEAAHNTAAVVVAVAVTVAAMEVMDLAVRVVGATRLSNGLCAVQRREHQQQIMLMLMLMLMLLLLLRPPRLECALPL